MQAEDKHKPLDQSSQPSTETEASKQYSDSFPLISFKSQQRSRQIDGESRKDQHECLSLT